MLTILKSISVILLLASSVSAHNTYFLPGDAFFFSRLDADDLQQLQTTSSPIFQYGNPFNGAAGCGYIGYEKIELHEMDKATKDSLVKSYRTFEKEIEAGLEKLSARASSGKGQFKSDTILKPEINVFVYSAEYDWKRFGIGIQYNENWLDESISFGTKHEHTRLNAFSSRSIVNNWRDSKLVEPLSVECPKLPAEHGKDFPMSWSKTPTRMAASKCRLIVIPNRDFDSYSLLPKDGARIIEIFDGKMTLMAQKDGEWTPVQNGE